MFTLTHHAYCGMPVPHGEFFDEAAARQEAADLIRRRRRQGFPVTTLEIGREWEVQEPMNCFMVPDQCGIISIRESDPEDDHIEFEDDPAPVAYVVDLQGEDESTGDCLPDFYATYRDAVEAGESAMRDHAEDRAKGLRDNIFGWAHTFSVREVVGE